MSVFIRIVLRVLAGYLAGNGVPPEIVEMVLGDPDVLEGLELVIGAALWFVVEVFYFMAKKFGWKT